MSSPYLALEWDTRHSRSSLRVLFIRAKPRDFRVSISPLYENSSKSPQSYRSKIICFLPNPGPSSNPDFPQPSHSIRKCMRGCYKSTRPQVEDPPHFRAHAPRRSAAPIPAHSPARPPTIFSSAERLEVKEIRLFGSDLVEVILVVKLGLITGPVNQPDLLSLATVLAILREEMFDKPPHGSDARSGGDEDTIRQR